ncbi:hypothetical protein WISP_131253 [Willisornis vidua]|uniref:Uncharacterized protein n=1 Tax=Willisornis vidua TaxID=1566151 RepID=A0ABQ9CSM8_9PASS|nr:hypothetical protein WISP_131253 [Willisornis vidua]
MVSPGSSADWSPTLETQFLLNGLFIDDLRSVNASMARVLTMLCLSRMLEQALEPVEMSPVDLLCLLFPLPDHI